MIIAKSILLANSRCILAKLKHLLANFGYILAKPFFINIQIIAYIIEPQL